MSKGSAKAVSAVRTKITWKKDFAQFWPVYVMFLPLMVYYIIFNYIPMGGIMMAFEKYSVSKGIFHSPWVGLKNFQTLFSGSGFPLAIRNTVCMAVLNLIFGFFPPLILAILFSEVRVRWFRRVAQIVSYMPNFVSAVVVCALVINFMGSKGAVTGFLSLLGLERQNWLANTDIPVFWIIYAFIGVWTGAGYGSIIYTTAISNVNAEMREAAALDGANRWQCIVHIVLPTILPMAMMMLTLSVGTVFLAGWDKVLLLYMPKTMKVSDVLYTYTYRMAFGDTVNFGVSTASGLFQSVVGTCLLLGGNYLNRKLTSYGLF